MKIVIVGGVAGGATAAARIRRLDERAEIIIFERSGFISYANCGLPYYIGGVIEDEQDLTLQTPESFFRRFKIVAKVHHEVTDIDEQNKTVSVTDLKTGTSFTESYDKLILSPGAKPVLPDFYAENERVFTLRTVEDTLKIRAFIEQKQPKTAVIIGGGFIGLETAENLAELGIQTTVIQRGNHLLPTVDCDMVSFIHANFRRYGVKLLLNTNTSKMSFSDGQVSLEFTDGNTETGKGNHPGSSLHHYDLCSEPFPHRRDGKRQGKPYRPLQLQDLRQSARSQTIRYLRASEGEPPML